MCVEHDRGFHTVKRLLEGPRRIQTSSLSNYPISKFENPSEKNSRRLSRGYSWPDRWNTLILMGAELHTRSTAQPRRPMLAHARNQGCGEYCPSGDHRLTMMAWP